MKPEDYQSNKPGFLMMANDWLSSKRVRSMNYAEKGVYHELLCTLWADIDCSIEDDIEAMAQLTVCHDSATGPLVSMDKIYACFMPHPGKEGYLTNKKLFEERLEMVEFSKTKSRAGAKGARVKWHSHKSAIGKRMAPTMANDSPSPSPSPSYKHIYSIFEFWNSLGIVKHKEFEKFKPCIKSKLKNYSEHEIKETMGNYKHILEGESYFFSYRWGLSDFLSRKNGFDQFCDLETAQNNYSTDKNKKLSQSEKSQIISERLEKGETAEEIQKSGIRRLQ